MPGHTPEALALAGSVKEQAKMGCPNLEGRFAEVSNFEKIKAQLKASKRSGTMQRFDSTAFEDIEYYPLSTCQAIITGVKGVRAEPCHICSTQRRLLDEQKLANCMMYANAVNNEKAPKVLLGYTSSIEGDYKFLCQHLRDHADIVLARWKNKGKTAAKRSEILLSAMPDMEKKKHCIPRFLHGSRNWYDHPGDRKAWLLPWLSVEELLENPNNIMYLLHNRTASMPQDWVLSDSKHIESGWSVGGLRLQYNGRSVVMQGADYGKLCTTSDRGLDHKWYWVAYPRARLILEAQAILYGFLRRFVEALLHGVPTAHGSEKWKISIVQSMLSPRSSNVERYATDMFLSHPKFAPAVLLEVIDARRKEAEDELWSLQTDAAYLQSIIRPALLSRSAKARDEMFGDLAYYLVTTAINRAEFWQGLAGICACVVQAHERYEETLSVDRDLPAEYLRALVAFEEVAMSFGAHRAENVTAALALDAAFADHFVLRELPDGRTEARAKNDIPKGAYNHNPSIPSVDYFAEDPLYWAIYHTGNSFKLPKPKGVLFDATMLLRFFEDKLSASSTKDKNRVNQSLTAALSDLAVIEQILTALRTHRPRIWLDGIPEEEKKVMRHSLQPYRVLRLRIQNSVSTAGRGGRELEAFYKAGWPVGAKTEEWLKHASISRGLLAEFWRSITELRKRAMRGKIDVTAQNRKDAMALFDATKTVEYLANLREEAYTVQRHSNALRASISETNAIFDSLRLHEPTHTLEMAAQEKKIKSKTRPAQPVTAECLQESEMTDHDEVEHNSVCKIRIRREHDAVFEAIFPSRNVTEKAMSVNWIRFTQAMVDAGFSMSQSRGSAVTFSKSDGSIVIHRPHPDPTLSSQMLQMIGRRLKRWFDWSRQSFFEDE